ncbi:MAG TPA: DUF222 domain-containing protein [Mycobacteriales bacterium]|nr:DUF222 domain-containing protein [Mycobacteriales bacterium]
MPRIADVARAHGLALNVDAQRSVRISLVELDVERGGLYARQLRALAELARLSVERPAHAVLEVAGTLGVGQDRARTLLEHGRRAVELYPKAVALLESGALRQATVELLLHVTAKSSDEVQAEVGVRVVDALIDADAADARALIVGTVLEVEADLDLDAQKDRHAQARANRGVWVKPVEDGMARIGAEVDQVTAQRFQLDLDEVCRAQKVADDVAGVSRTAEQRRADVLTDLPGRHLELLRAFQQGKTAAHLLGGDASGADVLAALCALPVRTRCTLYVHVPMSTLLDLDNRSGWIEGLGPVSAHHARLLRPAAALQAVWVDPATGIPIGIDPTVQPPVGEPDWDDDEQVTIAAGLVQDRLRSLLRPAVVDDRVEPGRFASTALARQVRIRDLRCTGVGCRMPASRCELDHLVAIAEGGQTAVWSLALKSPRCHHARHEGWSSVRDESDGSTAWISPLGGEYRRRSPWRPPPRVRGPLPPASLDRPDGGKPRTFGTEGTQSGVDAKGSASTKGASALEGRPRRVTALDQARAAPRDETPFSPSWSRPWNTDEPPPF